MINRFIRLSGPIFFSVVITLIAREASAQNTGSSHFRFGYTQRMRIETWDNTVSFDEDAGAGTSYFRNRTSFSVSWFPKAQFEFTARLTNEFKYYFVPENRHFNGDEVFFDLLYLKLDTILSQPLNATLGRQNLAFGEGFLVADGGPLDGARSAYFNALRLDYILNNANAIAFFAMYQPVRDDYLPVINYRERDLVEKDEGGIGLYYTGKFSKTGMDGYWLHKNTFNEEIDSPAERIDCIGARIMHPASKDLTITGEAAYQFGTRIGEELGAFGGYAYAEYATGWPLHFPRSFTIGTIYLSGDDTNTGKAEGWDPLFSRWPKWSDSYIYAYIWEGKVAYWSNINSYFFKTAADITEDLTFGFDFHHLLAPYGRSGLIPEDVADKNVKRGDLFIGRINYKLGKNATGHVIWESFKPGEYYFDDAHDYSWARMELMLKF